MVCVSNHEDMGRRVRRTAQIYTGSAWVELPVDGDQKLVYDRWNVIQVLDANNGDAVVRTYTWGLDLSGMSGDGSVEGVHGAGGIGGLLAVEVPQATGESRKYGYLYDGNGNVVQLVGYQNASETATLATHYEYDAYGRTAYAVNYDDGSAAAANPFRFSTKWLEDQTSANGFLYYFGYRYYSPRLGRWVSRDPLEELGSLNLLIFVNNAPGDKADLLGLAVLDELTELDDILGHLGKKYTWLKSVLIAVDVWLIRQANEAGSYYLKGADAYQLIEHGPKECCIGERTLIKNKTIKKYGKATAYITLLGMFSGYYWYQNDEINTYDCCGSGSTLMHDRTTKNTFPEKNTYGPFIWALFELTDEVREREWSCPSITVSLSELKPVGLGK